MRYFPCASKLALLWVTFLVGISPALAQPRDDREQLKELRQELSALRELVQGRLDEIDSRLKQLEAADGLEPTEPSSETEDIETLLREAEAALASSLSSSSSSSPVGANPQPSRVASAPAQSLNPQISVIGDFLGATSFDAPNVNEQAGLSLREVEIAFQSRIDPFARADFYVTVPNLEDVEIEEGFVTFLDLPSDLLLKAGKLRVPLGRANLDHRPESFTVDRPDVLTAYFGEEGLAEMGVSLSRLVPNPWDVFMELELDVLQGANEVGFGGGTGRDLLYNLRYRSFYDLTIHQNLLIGASYADGVHELVDGARLRSRFAGFDITYQWRPLRRGAYRSLIWQTELLRGDRDSLDRRMTSWGLYSFARYQLSRRWFVGGRFDRSPDPVDPEFHRYSQSAFVEAYPSEFQRFRVQYKHLDGHSGRNGHQLFFQWYYLIGTHGMHRF